MSTAHGMSTALGMSTAHGCKRAVLVGINYSGSGRGELRGCINDAQNHLEVLTTTFGFDQRNVHVLTDELGSSRLPTKRNICQSIEWLVSSARRGDVIFFAFSGHGSSVHDLNGDEADGQDEILIPCDMTWENKEWILDDWLSQKFHDELPDGVHCVCVYDCCSSGTIADLPVTTRSLGHARSDEQQQPTPRFLRAPAHLRPRQGHARPAGHRREGFCDLNNRQHRAPTATSPKTVWAFSGCADGDTSADALLPSSMPGGGKCYRGALTWALLESLKESGYVCRYDELIFAVRVKLQRFTQAVHLSTSSRELLSRVYLDAASGGATRGAAVATAVATEEAAVAAAVAATAAAAADAEAAELATALAAVAEVEAAEVEAAWAHNAFNDPDRILSLPVGELETTSRTVHRTSKEYGAILAELRPHIRN